MFYNTSEVKFITISTYKYPQNRPVFHFKNSVKANQYSENEIPVTSQEGVNN